ncbi:putative anion transporter 2, chloroplastic [Hordeum vulgare]|nr:putative anion transporter 2, chloroplastic [Hordeum vulgare]
MDRGESYVSMEIYEWAINFMWEVVVGYGPAGHRRSASFLEELHSKISSITLPVVVGGDFNLIRSVEDKRNCWVMFPRMDLFNDCIVYLSLRELDRRVSDSENVVLMAPFSKEEVWAAIKVMNPASPPGPNGLPVKFFMTF